MVLSATAFAQRIDFSGNGSEAKLETRLVASNAEVAPVEIRLSVPSIDLDKQTDGFDALNVSGLSPMAIPGNPELFGTGSLVAVPDGFDAVLTVLKQEEKELNNVVVAPAQKKFRCGVAGDSFKFNSALYQSRAAYPAAAASLEDVGRMAGLHFVRVALHPVRQILADKKLTITTELVARVSFKRNGTATRALHLSPAMYNIARNVAANGQGMGKNVDATAPELLLIVTADSLKASLSPLVEWKRAKGMQVDVVTATEAGGTTTDAVKAFVQNYYNTHSPKPSYLLFVGNKDTMPTFMESTASGSAASDWQYSLLGGSTHIPDVLYGRLAADNESEVATQINRWIGYEKAPAAGSWYPQGTTIASGEGSGPSDKEYAEQIQGTLKAGTYKQVDGFYQGEQTATASNITGALSDGRTWVTYIGHGSGTSWGSTNDTFNNGTVEGLSNTNKLPIIIDVACQNGSWVKINKCFGKAWVTQGTESAPAGAVGYYGGSVNVSWHEPAVMAVGVSKYHFEKPVTTLGGSVVAGQLYLVEKMGNGDNTLDNQKWYNLLGDPSLVVRTSVPAAYEVKHSLKASRGRIEITVTATDGAGKGLKGVVASVNTNAGTPLSVARTDAQGQAVLSVGGVSELEPNTVLTTTGYNVETHQVVLK